LQGNEWQKQAGNALLSDELQKRSRVATSDFVDQHERTAGRPRAEKLLEVNVETERSELQRTPTGCGLRIANLPGHQVG
jgi:hypothetical protein